MRAARAHHRLCSLVLCTQARQVNSGILQRPQLGQQLADQFSNDYSTNSCRNPDTGNDTPLISGSLTPDTAK
jgi:hypothetical protein